LWAVIRRCLVTLGWSCLLGACGSKFTAGDSPNAGGGSGAAAGGFSAGAGGSGQGGEASGGRAGEASSGKAGTNSGGAAAVAGAGMASGGAGAGGAPVTGHGGSSGNAGAAGGVDQPLIPQLGLALWLRADLGVQQLGGLVQTWQDQSGNQMNAAQTGANVRPQYLATGLNGLPTLKFDGQSNFLKLPDGFADFSHGLAGFMVAHPTASDCSSAVELSNGSEIEDIAFGLWQNKWTYEVEVPYIQNGNVDLLAPTLYAVNHRPAVAMVNAAADLRINGSLLQAMDMPLPSVPDSKARQNNFIGHTLYSGCNYFEGTISEIILYQRVMTANEVKAIESYLSQHWNLGPGSAL
jgi:hypothetical protein